MNFLDILIAAPLLYFMYKGWRHGLIFEFTALAGIVAGIWACAHLTTWVAKSLSLDSDSGVLIAFFITFVGAVALAGLLGKAIEGIFKMVRLNFVNKIAGSLFGMAKCLCVISVVINLVLLADPNRTVLTRAVEEKSIFFKPSYKVGSRLTATLKDFVDRQRDTYLEQHRQSQ